MIVMREQLNVKQRQAISETPVKGGGLDAQTRAAMLATGMEYGMEASYARLDSLAESYS
jgi:hypothetical protein